MYYTIFLIFVVILLILLVYIIFHKYIKSILDKQLNNKLNNKYQNNSLIEGFKKKDKNNEGGLSQEILAETSKIPESDKPCEDNTNILEVCMNSNCCDSNSKNCLCQNNKIKNCRELYNKCINDEYYDTEKINYIGLENKKLACKNILKGCCSYINKDLSNINITNDNDIYNEMSGIKNSKSPLCTLTSPEINSCKKLCNEDKKCKTIKYNTLSKTCELYDHIFTEQVNPAYAKSASKNKIYEKVIENFKSSNNNNNISKGLNYNLCSNYSAMCSKPENKCYCNNGIIQDCKKNFDKCMNNPNLNNVKDKKELCSSIFGSCCAIMDNIDLSDKFEFEEPVLGNGFTENLICDISKTVSSLDECQNACATNSECSFIDTNLNYITNGGQYNLKPTCKLFKGKYSKTMPSNQLQTPNKINTIYIKNVSKKEKEDKDKLKNLD